MNQSQESREKKAKDIITYNIAITQASLNVFCMEANSTIAKKKEEIKHLQRRYLAGKAQMEYQFGDPSFDRKLWEDRLDTAITKRNAEHNHKIKKMTDEYNKKRKALRDELDMTDQKISDYQQSINDSKSILKRELPNFDFSLVQDIGGIRQRIDNEKRLIQALEQKKSIPSNNSPRNIREILLSTKPVYGINNI